MHVPCAWGLLSGHLLSEAMQNMHAACWLFSCAAAEHWLVPCDMPLVPLVFMLQLQDSLVARDSAQRDLAAERGFNEELNRIINTIKAAGIAV